MQQGTAERTLVTVEEAAGRAGVSARTLYRLAGLGRLTLYRRPGRRRTLIDVEELERACRPAAVRAAGQGDGSTTN